MNKRIKNLVNALRNCCFDVEVEHDKENEEYYIIYSDLNGNYETITLDEDGKSFVV